MRVAALPVPAVMTLKILSGHQRPQEWPSAAITDNSRKTRGICRRQVAIGFGGLIRMDVSAG